MMSHAGDDATKSCLETALSGHLGHGTMIQRRLGRGMMQMPRHAGDNVAESSSC
jgi:hypothetical protein